MSKLIKYIEGKRKVDEASSSTSNVEGSKGRMLERSVSKISDSLYKFYEPEAADTANLDVYFFHDLELEGGSDRRLYISTWRSATEPAELWPQTWLPKKFPRARIISISYDASTEETDTEGRTRLYLIGENLLLEIMSARRDCGNVRPVILVGHGFGGIVIKQLCIQARDKRRELVAGSDVNMFLDSIRGIFFYSTPHHGVEGIEGMAAKEGPLLRWMYAFNAESAQLHEEFRQLWREKTYEWIVFGLGGTQWTSIAGGRRFDVREASSRFPHNYMTLQSDHFAICRPSDQKDNKYQHLVNLLQQVESRVQLERSQMLQKVPKVTVGVEYVMAEVLEKHLQDHRFLGFWGMGGVGKTTMAKLVFNKLCANFEFTCFVDEIKYIPGKKEEVKKEVGKRMHRHGVTLSASNSTNVWNLVTGRSLLVVFDDVAVSHAELLGEIAEDNNMPDSRFILTTRNKEVLRDLHPMHIIHLRALGHDDAEKLFITYAFPEQGKPPESLRTVVDQVVRGCEGLPLTLEILGKHLRGRNEHIWAEIPRALKICDNIANLEERVWAKLQLSYDGLTAEEKSMFLDIASFFINSGGFSAEEAIVAWSSTYGSVQNRLLVLEEKSLVHIKQYELTGFGVNKYFYMHEHIRRMGERIARGSHPDATSFLDLYPRDGGTIFPRGIQLENIVALKMEITEERAQLREHSCVLCMMQDVLHRLAKIQYMDLEIPTYSSCDGCRGQSVTLPSTLLMLRLQGVMENLVLPPEACEKLAVLKIQCGYDYKTRFRIGEVLSLNTCDYFTKLERLDLYGCSLADLARHSLRKLQQLRFLSIGLCSELGNLLEAIGGFRRLQRLTLSYISEMLELPDTFGNLTGLEWLVIHSCKLRALPVTFRNLTRLEYLRLDRIVGGPNVIGQLPLLRVLEMDLPAIDDFGDAVGHLKSLERLNLECPGGVELPDTFGDLTSLRELTVRCSLLSLPGTFGKLTNLESLELVSIDHTRLELPDTFGDLTSLRKLRLDCSDLSLPGTFGKLTNLESLELVCTSDRLFRPGGLELRLGDLRCSVLSLPCTFGKLTNPESLELGCTDHRLELPDTLGDLTSLRRLLFKCSVVSLPGTFRYLTNLESLELECRILSLPATLSDFTGLKELRMDVSGLGSMDDLAGRDRNLCALERLYLEGEGAGELAVKLGCFGTLRILSVTKCPSLQALSVTLGNFIRLESLLISGAGVRSLPDSLGQLPHLQSLSLWFLENLESLPETLGHLRSLESLSIWWCSLQSLPESMGQLSSLRDLSLNGCRNLRTLPETIGILSRLEELSLSGCSSLRSLPHSLVNLSQLGSLDVYGCKSLPREDLSYIQANLPHLTLID